MSMHKRITYVREKWGRFERELIGLNSLETLAEPGACFRAEMNINMRTESCVRKISVGNIFIVYTKTTNSSTTSRLLTTQ